MSYSDCMPRDFPGKLDSRLPQVAKQLRRELSSVQRKFAKHDLKLNDDELDILSGMFVDLAADRHTACGLWDAYERFNRDCFGVPLPLTADDSGVVTDEDRFRHLLWKAYELFLPGYAIDPSYHAVARMAECAHAFLSRKFATFPADWGVKNLLASPNEFGWDVKRKLVWLGTRSYLFRLPYWNYLAELEGETGLRQERESRRIDQTDDFLCQECTIWSGLGAVDLLADVLDISQAQRAEIRRWHARHVSAYRLEQVADDHVKAVNLVNGEAYTIRHDRENRQFAGAQGRVVFGGTVPWRGEWYWSGAQRLFPSKTDAALEEVLRQLKRQTAIVCRYWPERESAVREMQATHTRRMLEFYGTDLKVYPDGLFMAADWEREMRAAWETYPPEQRAELADRHALPKGRPEIPVPEDLLMHDGGLAVFIHPDEGKEIALEATAVVGALGKKGAGLSADEREAVRGWFYAEAVSPKFIRRMLAEYGGEASIRAAFMLGEGAGDYWLEYLLRCHKGHFYRTRYPCLSIA